MTIIVDANSTHKLFNQDEAGSLIFDKIVCGELVYVTGGRHREEVLAGGMKREVFNQLLLAGRIRVYASSECSENASHIKTLHLQSDDPHIIALAIRSGCRILFSFDVLLCKDFKRKEIIDNPRGKIFQTKSHLRLLKKVAPPRA